METIGMLRMGLVKMQSAWNQNAPIVLTLDGVKYGVDNFFYRNGELNLGLEVLPTKWRIEKTFISSDCSECAPLCNGTYASPDEAILAAAQNIYAEIGNQEEDIRWKCDQIVDSLKRGVTYSFANVMWRIVGE